MSRTAMIRLIVPLGAWAWGHQGTEPGTAATLTADEWIEEGFAAAEANEWLGAGCFSASAAAELRDAEVTPEQASAKAKWGPCAGETIGYAVANGDMGTERAIAEIGGAS